MPQIMDHHAAYLAVQAAFPELVAALDQIGIDTAEASVRLDDLVEAGIDPTAESTRQERDRITEYGLNKQYFAALDSLGIRLPDHEDLLRETESQRPARP